MTTTNKVQKVLSIDIGGSSIKATMLNPKGDMITEYIKVATPQPSNPENILKSIKALVSDFSGYSHVSAGFPGYVRDGIIRTAPNLGSPSWAGTNFAEALTRTLGKPARVVNDADMQGLGVASGKGMEMMITLGTGSAPPCS
ncbi:MAG: ROK family protein [Edaphocola sp.]